MWYFIAVTSHVVRIRVVALNSLYRIIKDVGSIFGKSVCGCVFVCVCVRLSVPGIIITYCFIAFLFLQTELHYSKDCWVEDCDLMREVHNTIFFLFVSRNENSDIREREQTTEHFSRSELAK